MTLLREALRHARDIVNAPAGSISANNVQAALEEIDREKLPASQKAQPNGVASLDGAGKVPQAQLPVAELSPTEILDKLKTVDGPGSGLDADTVDGKQADALLLKTAISNAIDSTSSATVASSQAAKTAYDMGKSGLDRADSAHSTITANDASYKASFEKIVNRDKANGYAGLDSAGKLNPDMIPGQTIVNVKTYASTTARNADKTNHKGDMAIVEKSGGSADLYILKKDPAGAVTTDADWLTLQTSITVDVRSWNNRTGAVMPAKGDYTTAQVLHDGGQLDSAIVAIKNSIPTTAGDLNAYTKPETDGKFIAKTAISNAIDSTSSATVASSQAAKTAYDRGTTALNTANGKIDQATADGRYLGKTAKAVDADKLDGLNSTNFVRTSALSDSISSDSSATAATSKAAKLAYDRGSTALNTANGKLGKTEKAADADKLDGQDSVYYRNAANLNAGTLPAARSSVYRVVTNDVTAVHGDQILVDLSAGDGVTVNLPPTPSPGQHVTVFDAAALCDSKPLIIGRNTKNIMGSAENVTFDVPGYRATFAYLNSTRGWVVA